MKTADVRESNRVYFGQDGQRLVILLLGGTKKRQQRDIAQAKAYWRGIVQPRCSPEERRFLAHRDLHRMHQLAVV